MEDVQSTIDSLKKLNTKFILQIDELRKKNADIKAENIKLKQDKAEIKARFIKLEQNDKDTAFENAELKAKVAKLKQKQSQTDEKNNFIVKLNDDAKEIDQFSPKSLKNIEIDNFLDSTYKEKVSKERIREKILQQNLFLNNTSLEKVIPKDSSTVLLLSLGQLFDKATDAEYGAIHANQKEILCWYYYEKGFLIQVKVVIQNAEITLHDANDKSLTPKISARGFCQNSITNSSSSETSTSSFQLFHTSNSKDIISKDNKSLLNTEISILSPKAGLCQYAIEHKIDSKKFLVITEAKKNKWTTEYFHGNLKIDICFYHAKIERKKDFRKYCKFLTDQERLVSEELLCHGILKSGLSTAWLDDLIKKCEKIYAKFIQISFEEKTLFVCR
ncbi:17908_t:CDS:2 [Cetraspora pellucida]|uniref:17908_t:CDS:1 n=1 Tax=Cetraspora pellucida TaxID=1433469 RepID=A0A9N9EZB2_9GLOM|nr:17908_t:CDS:2 [Cetraspora pellucida]